MLDATGAARGLAAGRLTVNGEPGIIARVLVRITDFSMIFVQYRWWE